MGWKFCRIRNEEIYGGRGNILRQPGSDGLRCESAFSKPRKFNEANSFVIDYCVTQAC